MLVCIGTAYHMLQSIGNTICGVITECVLIYFLSFTDATYWYLMTVLETSYECNKLYTYDVVKFGNLMIHYLKYILCNITTYFTVYNTTSSLPAECVSLLLHQTDRTELTEKFVLSIKCAAVCGNYKTLQAFTQTCY